MLDHAKLLKELKNHAQQLFVSYLDEYAIAQQVFEKISDDPTFIHTIKKASNQWALPQWTGQLNSALPIAHNMQPYQALSVDGSQIYPDRHQGVSCFLINIGSVMITYGTAPGNVQLTSTPHLFLPDMEQEMIGGVELVNCRRQELEFSTGLQLAKSIARDDIPTVLFFDGSLIFWHLSGQDTALKEYFFPRYIKSLQEFYENRQLFACYASFPKNKELVNLMRFFLSENDPHADEHTLIPHVIDNAVAQFFLMPAMRSTVFCSTVALCEQYPDHLRPYFFYLRNHDEIGRVEIPAWIAHDENLVDLIAATILDQCTKGRGYPVVLAEAHEQAVIKGPDRDFFYHAIAKIGIECKKRNTMSQKSIKKRGIGI